MEVGFYLLCRTANRTAAAPSPARIPRNGIGDFPVGTVLSVGFIVGRSPDVGVAVGVAVGVSEGVGVGVCMLLLLEPPEGDGEDVGVVVGVTVGVVVGVTVGVVVGVTFPASETMIYGEKDVASIQKIVSPVLISRSFTGTFSQRVPL